jgi:hypothetical protein
LRTRGRFLMGSSRLADHTSLNDVGTLGFALGVAWSVGLSMSQEAGTPWWLRGPVFVGLAVVALRWFGGWRAS